MPSEIHIFAPLISQPPSSCCRRASSGWRRPSRCRARSGRSSRATRRCTAAAGSCCFCSSVPHLRIDEQTSEVCTETTVRIAPSSRGRSARTISAVGDVVQAGAAVLARDDRAEVALRRRSCATRSRSKWWLRAFSPATGHDLAVGELARGLRIRSLLVGQVEVHARERRRRSGRGVAAEHDACTWLDSTPPLPCASATSQSSTWRSPHSPRSWRTASTIAEQAVHARGGSRTARRRWCSSAARRPARCARRRRTAPPSPLAQKPRSSRNRIGVIVNAS